MPAERTLFAALRGVRRAAIHLLMPASHPVNRYLMRERVERACGGRIAAGPFRGMVYIGEAAGSSWCPKALGTYEKELHALIDTLVSRDYDCIVNVGCGEGYYAVGMAYRTRGRSGPSVHAYDIDPRARELTRALAERNGLSHRLRVGGECDFRTLESFEGARALLVCDIEGDEAKLLDPAQAPMLAGCDILVEVHDGNGGDSIQRLLRERFGKTHAIESRHASLRSLEDFPQLDANLGKSWALEAMNEGRTLGLQWLFLEARREPPATAGEDR